MTSKQKECVQGCVSAILCMFNCTAQAQAAGMVASVACNVWAAHTEGVSAWGLHYNHMQVLACSSIVLAVKCISSTAASFAS